MTTTCRLAGGVGSAPAGRACRLLVALFLSTPAVAAIPPAIEHPERTVGPETCGGCHDRELAVWQGTAHAALYRGETPLHQRPRAREIAAAMEVRLIKHDSLCLDCHFTPQRRGERVTARDGVSCESCHGAARDWLTVHNNFQGRDTDRAGETATETATRVARNAAAGMVFSGVPYELVSRCFRCHTVPDQRLVEVGGHTRGGELDLLARLDVIRHNFVRGGRATNAPFPVERRREYLVLGALAELELQLRAIAAAASDGAYVAGKARRVDKLLRELGKLRRRVASPQLEAALAAAEGLDLAAGSPELAAAADRVRDAGRAFAAAHDGSELAELDGLVAGGSDDPEGAGGAPAEVAALGPLDEAEPLGAVAAESAPGGAGSGDGAAATRPERSAGVPAAATAPRQQPTGKVAAQLRAPLSSRRVVGQGACDACHATQNDWWYGDPHRAAADPFFDPTREVVQISFTYYGRRVDDALATARAVCMDCHGSVETGAVEVESGPSCESCHGPAGDFLKPHPQSPRAQRLALGMVDLADPRRRVEVCAGCHYVTDPRLLASGHPSGADFDPAARMGRIAHWQRAQPAADALRAAWSQVRAARGPIPEVAVVSAEVPGSGRDRVARAAPAGSAAEASRRAAGAPYPAPAARPFGDGAADGLAGGPGPGSLVPGPSATAPREVRLAPWPDGVESLPLDRLLELVASRLDPLYRENGDEP